jgi:Protein of unknown function (DUF2721)
MSDPSNPYAALSLIVAPAVLTNASSILVLSTSNRLARAVDRARALATELDTPAKAVDLAALRLRELDSAARRAVMLLGALRLFYASIGSFAAAALTSLIGAALLGSSLRALPATFEILALAAEFGGVMGLVLGCVLLLRETRIAVRTMTDEATLIGAHFANRTKTPSL